MGDMNNDGFPDVIQGNANPYPVELYLSSGGEANWLKVSVEGSISNRDGIGSKIRVYTPLNTQYRETYCGEGYLSQNSQREIFGLGEVEVIDSLSIDWPSGMREVYYDLPANETYHFIEGDSFQVNALSTDLSICPGDSTLLVAQGLEGLPANWNTGFVGDSMYVSVPGSYSFSTQNTFGVEATSNEIEIVYFDPQSSEVSLESIACFGEETGAASLLDTSFTNIVWENGETGEASQLPYAWNTYTALDGNGCLVNDSVFIDQAAPLTWEVNTVDEVLNLSLGAAVITPDGGTPPYTFDWGNENCDSNICANLSAGEYTVVLSDAALCSSNITIVIDGVTSINEKKSESFDLFPNPVNETLFLKNASESSYFEIRTVSGELVLNGRLSTPSIKVSNLAKGTYLFILQSAEGVIKEKALFIKI